MLTMRRPSRDSQTLPPFFPSRSLSGIGVLPYYMRRLVHGEYPRVKDDFEKVSIYHTKATAGESGWEGREARVEHLDDGLT